MVQSVAVALGNSLVAKAELSGESPSESSVINDINYEIGGRADHNQHVDGVLVETVEGWMGLKYR